MLVRSAGDRATSAQPPTLVRLYVALCLTYHPSLHPPSLSLSPFARSPPSSAWDIPYIRSLDAAATLTRARARSHTHTVSNRRRFGVIYAWMYEARCTNDRPPCTYVWWSTVVVDALCKSVRYLDTCKGKCVRAYAHPPLPFHPPPPSFHLFSSPP